MFQLEYKIQDVAPLSTIFTKDVIANYLKIFSFLWKLKKVQHYLSLSWGINMANQSEFRKIQGPLQNQFHRFTLAHHEMALFVQNVHNYILVEVLESAWTEFKIKLETVKDLDQLILIQRQFVSDILDRSLLSDKQRDLYKLVQKLLN